MGTGAATLVLGLGNPVLSDDAAGLRAASALAALLEADPIEGVWVGTSTRGGFELIDLLAGSQHAIIIDALTVPSPSPGAIRRLTLTDVAGSARLIGAHDISVATAFELAAQLGIRMPSAVEIIGVECADTLTVSEGLTPEVEAAVEALARELHGQLKARNRGCD